MEPDYPYIISGLQQSLQAALDRTEAHEIELQERIVIEAREMLNELLDQSATLSVDELLTHESELHRKLGAYFQKRLQNKQNANS